MKFDIVMDPPASACDTVVVLSASFSDTSDASCEV